MTNFFKQVMLEAEGDEAPDIISDQSIDVPPDLNIDDNDSTLDESDMIDTPPDIDGFDDVNIGDETSPEQGEMDDLDINEKISAVMNANLYQKFLSLIVVISDHVSALKNYHDEIHSISPDSLSILEALNKLRDNINLYLSNNFINNNYSGNLLFFNKCTNLLNLLDQKFAKDIKSGN